MSYRAWLWLAAGLAAAWLAPEGRAQPWTEERVWMAAGGGELRARLVDVDARGDVRLATAEGTREVPALRLAREDRIFVFRYASERLRRVVPATVRPEELTSADRWLLPSLDQDMFGARDGDCVPNAFANFLFWWHDLGVLPLRAPADRSRMAQTAHDRLAQLCKTSNTGGTDLAGLVAGAAEYVAAQPTTLALVGEARTFASLAELQAAIQPDMAVVLGVELRRGSALSPRGHAVSVVAVDAPTRTSTLHTWGERLSGHWVSVVIRGEPCLQFVLPTDPSRPEGRMEREGALVLREGRIEAALLRLRPAAEAARPGPPERSSQ